MPRLTPHRIPSQARLQANMAQCGSGSDTQADAKAYLFAVHKRLIQECHNLVHRPDAIRDAASIAA
jgi:hypothetical protein